MMRTFVNAATNASTRGRNQNGDWRVPDNLWREATLEKRETFNELRRRSQANRRLLQPQQPIHQTGRRHGTNSSILPQPEPTELLNQNATRAN